MYRKYAVANSRYQFCVEDPDDLIYLQGTRDSTINEEDHSYIVYETVRCSEAEYDNYDANAGYPDVKIPRTPCADPEVVEPEVQSYTNSKAWTEKKIVAMKLLNTKIDFYDFSELAIRYNEVFIPGVPMNMYSDTGYRFRYNEFERQDGWFGPKNVLNAFFDYMFYNSDTYPSGPKGVIAEMYFRLEVDQVSHGRVVYTIMDFIGDLGGVPDLLLQICGWVLGGWAAFHSSFATLSHLFRVKSSEANIFLPAKSNNP